MAHMSIGAHWMTGKVVGSCGCSICRSVQEQNVPCEHVEDEQQQYHCSVNGCHAVDVYRVGPREPRQEKSATIRQGWGWGGKWREKPPRNGCGSGEKWWLQKLLNDLLPCIVRQMLLFIYGILLPISIWESDIG